MALQVGEVQQYLANGPGFIFLWHPSLGPLWDIIAQKVTGGALAPGAELILEVCKHTISISLPALIHVSQPPRPALASQHELSPWSELYSADVLMLSAVGGSSMQLIFVTVIHPPAPKACLWAWMREPAGRAGCLAALRRSLQLSS